MKGEGRKKRRTGKKNDSWGSVVEDRRREKVWRLVQCERLVSTFS